MTTYGKLEPLRASGTTLHLACTNQGSPFTSNPTPPLHKINRWPLALPNDAPAPLHIAIAFSKCIDIVFGIKIMYKYYCTPHASKSYCTYDVWLKNEFIHAEVPPYIYHANKEKTAHKPSHPSSRPKLYSDGSRKRMPTIYGLDVSINLLLRSSISCCLHLACA